MKFIKTIVATVAIVAATATTVQARDSFSIGVNIGGYGHGHGYSTHSIGTHRHAPAFYGYYGAPTVYYSPRPIVYYAPPARYNHYQPHAFDRRDVRRHGGRHHNHRDDGRRGRR
jgi:hypothetical protein